MIRAFIDLCLAIRTRQLYGIQPHPDTDDEESDSSSDSGSDSSSNSGSDSTSSSGSDSSSDSDSDSGSSSDSDSTSESGSGSDSSSDSKSGSGSHADSNAEYPYEYSDDDESLGFKNRWTEEEMRDDRLISRNGRIYRIDSNGRKRYWVDNITRYFKEKLEMSEQERMKSYKLPKTLSDTVELEPLQFEYIDPLRPYRPILVNEVGPEGVPTVVQKVAGFRELLDKRGAWESLKEQYEIKGSSGNLKKIFGWKFISNLSRLWKRKGLACFYNEVSRNVYRIPVGGKKKKPLKKKSHKPSSAGKKTQKKGRRRSDASGAPTRRSTAVPKTPGAGKRRKTTATLKGKSSKNVKSIKSKSVSQGPSKKSTTAGKRKSTVSAKTKLTKGESKVPARKPQKLSLSVPSHILAEKVLPPEKLKAPDNTKTGTDKPEKSLTQNSARALPGPSKTTVKAKEPLIEPEKKKGFLNWVGLAGKKAPEKETNKIPDKDAKIPDKDTKKTPEKDTKIIPDKKIETAKNDKKEKPHPKTPAVDKNQTSPKTVTFDETAADKSKDKKEKSKDDKEEKKVHKPRRKRKQRKRKPTLTEEDIAAVRKHELHLERDAEWLELSESDKEDEDRLRSETFGKEKFKWMKRDLSYESQLLSRELRVFTNVMNWTGRQPVHIKEDVEIGLVQYLIDRKKQIPFAVTSLILWIASVFIIQGWIDVSTQTDDDNLYLQVEQIELEKFKIPLFAFFANLFLPALWGITVLLKDGLFICQYLNSVMASLTQMEISCAVGIRRLAIVNYVFVSLCIFVLSIAFYYDYPRTVRGSSGLIAMLLFRSFIQEIRVNEDHLIYFQIFGFVFNMYVVFCSRGVLTLMQLLASILRQAAQKWNFKFGAKFGQFGIRSRGHLIRLRLNQSLIKIFIHHRFVIGLTSLYGQVFATPIASYFILQLSVFAYYLIYLYRYKDGKPEDFKKNGGEFFTFTHETVNNLSVPIENYLTKGEDYLTVFWALTLTLIDFIYTTESIAAAGTAVIIGFEFVRRHGQILCDNSHERRLIQSLQWSFSATRAAIVNVNQFFAVNRPSIISGLGTALVMFSLIIQLNQAKTQLMITEAKCTTNATLFCYVTRRVAAPDDQDVTKAVSIATTQPPLINKQQKPYRNTYWFWNDCDTLVVRNNFTNSSIFFNTSLNLPTCFGVFHEDDTDSFDTYPEQFVSEEKFNMMKNRWEKRNNGSLSPAEIIQFSVCRDMFDDRMEFNFHTCFSQLTQKFLIIADVFICPDMGCPLVWLRGLRNNSDCIYNPYPISPFFTNATFNNSSRFAMTLMPGNDTNSTSTNSTSSLMNRNTSLGIPVFMEADINNNNTVGLRRLGYFDCYGNEIDTVNGRDDCGWLPIPRRHEMDIPEPRIVIPGALVEIPGAYGEVVNTTKWCYTHSIERCKNESIRKYCPWANIESKGYAGFIDGFLYGSDCYNSSLFFEFVEPDNFSGICRHRFPTEYMTRDGRFHLDKELEDAMTLWQRPDYTLPPASPAYVSTDFPCLARSQATMGGKDQMNGFTQAKDFRRICTGGNGAENYWVDIVFERTGSGVSPFKFEDMRMGNSCWMWPYAGVDSSIHFDCWGNQAALDECRTLNQTEYVGPFYRRNEIIANISVKVFVAIEIKHHYVGNRNPYNVSRICWNSTFALRRCNDPNIECVNDKEEHGNIVFYGKMDCDNQGLGLDQFNVCQRYSALRFVDNITAFLGSYYEETRKLTWENPDGVYRRDCSKPDIAKTTIDFMIMPPNETLAINYTTWNCSEMPGFFHDFYAPNKTDPILIDVNRGAFPCQDRRNTVNCTNSTMSMGNCTAIGTFFEILNFRVPCRDRNNVIRAWIPRFLYPTPAPAVRTKYYDLTTVPMEQFRGVHNLSCWDIPILRPDLKEFLWAGDTTISNAGVYDCWGDGITPIQLSDIDDCGWYQIEEIPTGFPPQVSKARTTISVNVFVDGMNFTSNRSCWNDTFSMMRCMDPDLKCRTDAPVQVSLYGKENCSRFSLSTDPYGGCTSFFSSTMIDNITFFPAEYYQETQKKTWENPDGDYTIQTTCAKLPAPRDFFCPSPERGTFLDFLALFNGASPTIEMRLPDQSKNPCLNRRLRAPGCTTNQPCTYINPMVEALNFRLPCRDRNNTIKAMIPRFLFRGGDATSARGRIGTYWGVTTPPLDQLRRDRNLTCWENPYLLPFIWSTSLQFLWNIPTQVQGYSVEDCWDYNVNLSHAVSKVDDCGWIQYPEFPTGFPPVAPSGTRKDVTVMLSVNGTMQSVTRSCWDDEISQARCSDTTIQCWQDPVLVALYGADCMAAGLPFDDFWGCTTILPLSTINNISHFPGEYYLETQKRTWGDPDGDYTIQNCTKPPGTPGAYNFICPDREPGAFLDFQTVVPPSGFDVAHEDLPCTNRRTRNPECNPGPCTFINPMVEALNFRLPCRDKDNKTRAMIPRLLLHHGNATTLRGKGGPYYGILTLPLEQLRRDNNLNCWENPFMFPGNTRVLWNIPAFTTQSGGWSIRDCWDFATNMDINKRLDLFDDCGSLPFPEFPTGLTPPVPAKVNVPVTISLNGTPVPFTRSCWSDKFAQDRCSDLELKCKNDPTLVSVALYGVDCNAASLTLDEFGGCTDTLPSSMIDNITYFLAEYYEETRKMTWGNPDGDYTIQPCNKPPPSPTVPRFGWTCPLSPGTFLDFTSVGTDVFREHPCANRRTYTPACSLNQPCTFINPMVEALNFRVPCRDRNNVVRAMIPRFIIRHGIFQPRGKSGSYWGLGSAALEGIRRANSLSCWENPFLLPDYTTFLWDTAPYVTLQGPLFFVEDCWSRTNYTVIIIDDCGWFPFSRYPTGSGPLQLSGIAMTTIDVNKTGIIVQRNCFSDELSMERCRDPDIRCRNDP